MMKIISLILILLIIVSVQGASATSIVLNNTDDFVEINGVKTFVIAAHNICNYGQDNQFGNGNCSQAVTKFNNFTVSYLSLYRGTIGEGYTQDEDTYMNTSEQLYESEGIYYAQYSGYNKANLSAASLFGYSQYPEEITSEAQYQQAYANHNTVHSYDVSGRPMIMANTYYNYGRTYDTGDVADIGLFDIYSYVVDCDTTDRYYHDPPTCSDGPRMLYDFLYAKESSMQSYWLNHTAYGSGYTTLESMPNATWMIESGLGSNYNESQKTFVPIPKQELRGFTYWSAVVGATGVAFWAAKINAPNGLDTNVTVAKYYNDFAGEITSGEIQDILTLPTLNYSWNYYLPWDNKVTFSSNPFKTVDAIKGYQHVYRLKYNATSNKYYLIVINKDTNVTNNLEISIDGLTGTWNAITKGITATGSALEHRTTPLTITNGIFTDSFDGYAAHVYEISSPDSPSSTTEYSICFSGCNATWSSFIIEGQ